MSQMLEVKRQRMTQADDLDENADSDESSDSDDDDLDDTSPAQAGVIERLVLKNFMCHESFELELGPQLNFIIGRNGSGKSAVLTGISVGLGAKASDTSRGSSIKSLIKDGNSMARVIITFKNEGSEAYRPEVYGPKIIVERKLQRHGTNSYSIRSAANKTISTKKVTLEEILYKFNITIDNPLAFLSQDKAREFLTTTTDKTKYDYFMSGSLIHDILENYKNISLNIVEVKNKSALAKAHFDAAVKKYQESASMYNKFKQSDNLRKQLHVIHGKIHWFNVSLVERVIKKYEDNIAQAEADLEKLDSEVKKCDEQLLQHTNNRTKLEEAQSEAEHRLSESFANLLAAKEAIAEWKASVKQIESEIKLGQDDIESYKSEIKKFEKLIKIERKRIDDINGGSKETLSQELKQLEEDVKGIERERDKIKDNLLRINDGGSTALKPVLKEIEDSQESYSSLKKSKDSISSSRREKYSAWGASVSVLLDRISNRKDWHFKPLGPIGSFVSVKSEYSKWADLINAQYTKTLDSFLVRDEHDRRILNEIMKSMRMDHKSVIVKKFESFEYKLGMPDRRFKTVLDAINVESPDILYTLIDVNGIEKHILCDSIEDAKRFANAPNVQNAFSLYNSRSGNRESFEGNTLRHDAVYYNSGPHKLSSVSGNPANDIANIERQMEAEQQTISNLRRKLRELKLKTQNEEDELRSLLSSKQRQIRNLNDEIFKLENKLNEDGDLAKIEGWTSQIAEFDKQIKNRQGIVLSLTEDMDKESTKFQKLKATVSEWTKATAAATDQKTKAQTAIVEFDADGNQLLASREHWENSKAKRVSNIERFNAKLTEGREKLVGLVETAEAKCRRDEVTIHDEDTTESITEEYTSAQKAVREAEGMLGKTKEEIQSELLLNKQAKDQSEERVINLNKTYRELEYDLNNRFNYLHTTILKNIGEASSSFERSLALRGFKGELRFGFNEKTLTMLVQTQGGHEPRTVESLSGGEKSFTQIALLLAIWRVMDSKIRGLDEFDVFMDSVNRSISIRLLLNELRQYPKSQSIFITPQDIAAVGDLDSADVKIYRMDDPRRD